MTKSEDPRHHYEIWSGPSPEYGDDRRSITYVENHNAQCSYGELADDFTMAADALIERYCGDGLGNWVAPVAHMVRQTIELRLKALVFSISERDEHFNKKPLGRHDLEALWHPSKVWLSSRGFRVLEDARLDKTERIIGAFHAIDPTGDLFRFGISRQTAFDKQKSYDRIGLDLEVLSEEFAALCAFLSHWDAAVFRMTIREQMGWEDDPFFDIDAFPRPAGADEPG